MNKPKKTIDNLIWGLQERAKELNCLYKIEELMNKPEADIDDICKGIAAAIPPGWQYPDICVAEVLLEGKAFYSPNFERTPWVQKADIIVQDKKAGEISVYYTQEMPRADDGPFLKEETKLLDTIVDRLSHFITYKRMQIVFNQYRSVRQDLTSDKADEWQVALNFLKQTDKNLYMSISRRMLNHLTWAGIDEAEQLLRGVDAGIQGREGDIADDENRPHQGRIVTFDDQLCDATFLIASKHLSREQILSNIQKWIQEDRLSFLVQATSKHSSLGEVIDAVRRYYHIAHEGIELPPASKRGVQASLIRRFLLDLPEFINLAKDYIDIGDFHEIVDNIVFTPESRGRLGGKGAGLFFANQIIKKSRKSGDDLDDIKVPKTWYIASDVLFSFLSHNKLTDVTEQKYKDINQIRIEYPHIIQTFKTCSFPTEVVQSLSMILDDFKERPLIVRSSSLLEDRAGASFSGKYKSLFLANQGSKETRLEALMDAIAEVYASLFGPDPIEYRAERGLLDFSEEMGIMIQEVVGTKVGDYFIPTFAGVAFSRNEFRWSPRIKYDDGLLRLVPGLGTRAVDRLGNDYPVLIAPGQIGLRVNVAIDEVIRYSPKQIDVINLKTNTFDTISIDELLKKSGEELPQVDKVVSVYDGHHIRKPLGKHIDFEKDNLVVTFEGLVADTKFVKKIQDLLNLLEEKLRTPVDIEFASDGKDFYLLQCRAQSYSKGHAPVAIPDDIQEDKIIFSADRYISNGLVPDISHIVYVDPHSYDGLTDQSSLLAVGRAVGSLNKLLPRRRFILMGPGRWGSRGDIKLGVRVTYSDINNTAAIIEIARKKGNYVPDLSFGTHFFQDLVESEIYYLPLYPDDKGIIFNENFFEESANILADVLPEFANLSRTLKVIDVTKGAKDQVLRILMNAEVEKAIGFLCCEAEKKRTTRVIKEEVYRESKNFWAWRFRMAENIAAQLDAERFGVKGFYVFGSTKNATAGPESDIDILIHFIGTKKQRHDLLLWLEAWSLSLDEMNYLRTGHRTGGLLDIHIVTDEDIANKNSYALKIGAVTDAARPLPMMKKS
ncbi:MAG: PEP/pyruvate-binding domain-containing protein [Candidatus Aminicenantes bacterium]|jgi:predicted nucleotidyltransferase